MTARSGAASVFEEMVPLTLQTGFDGGKITSDGGLAWLAEADRELGLCEALADHVPEWRRGEVHYSLEGLVRCEREGIRYTIGLISNPRLEDLAAPLLEQAIREFEPIDPPDGKVRLLSEARYQAGSWDGERRVVYKAEVRKKA